MAEFGASIPISPDDPRLHTLEDDIIATADGVPCEFLCGRAGTGKTFEIVRRVAADDGYGILTATTGIASVNLGAVTLNSVLGYFDTASMRDAFLSGRLARSLHELALEYRWLIVDEVSMLAADQLDILHRAVEEANRYRDVRRPLGILLVGDFAQLPPVKARWTFEADCWPRFAANTVRLEKVWRQDGGLFLDALNFARSGNGPYAAIALAKAGAVWHTAVHTEFDGTTILPKNDMVGRFNAIALDRVPGPKIVVRSRRWGQQRSEWGESRRTHEWGIPPELTLKVGAYVMILSNDVPEFNFVNGDCGHVVSYSADDRCFTVKLVRTGREERIHPIVRGVEVSDKPDGWDATLRIPASEDDNGYRAERHYRGRVRRYVLGQVEFYPLRLAYASTVHKSQSLTLDRVQVDYRDGFFKSPGMLYVAISRCRSLAGLRLVGDRDRFIQRCVVDARIRQWL